MLKKIYLLIFSFTLILIYSQTGSIDSPIIEGFESSVFPPTGWFNVNVTGGNYWERSTLWSHTGNAAAFINYQSYGGEDWMITPRRYINTGDSISLWVRKQLYSSYSPDSLLIKASITDSALSSFNIDLIKINVATLPSATWVQFKISLNNISGNHVYFGFQHKDFNGNGCYIDDIVITGTGIVGMSEIKNKIPEYFILNQNFPNPFNPQTTIKFSIPISSEVRLSVYNILGNEIDRLLDGKINKGIYDVKFDASSLSSGIYYYTMNVDGVRVHTKKMVLLK
jgi:hypothetical protein